jgi:hypothetical protein
MRHNGLQLAEGGAFEAPSCQATTNVYSEPKSFCHHVRPAFGKVLLWAGVLSFVFVHILIANARPITVCQTIKNVAGSPKNLILKIFCPLRSSVNGGTNKAKSAVTTSPILILSILMVRLKDSKVNSPDNAQIKNIECSPRKLLPRNSPDITEKKKITVVSIPLRTKAWYFFLVVILSKLVNGITIENSKGTKNG